MMDWLSGLVGENAAHIISFIGLFVLFLLAIFVVFAAIKRMTAGTYVSKKHDAAPRLTVTDAAAVESQRRLVLVRRDDVEHLILIGGPSDIVIEQNIIRHKNNQPDYAAPRPQRKEERSPIAPVVPAPAAAAAIVQPPVAAAEQSFNPDNTLQADIISAAPVYKPETEAMPVQPRAATPVQAPAQPTATAASQPLQTHAQQVAAARQQQSQQQTQRPAPRPAEAGVGAGAPKLHPVYPLGQVSRGVIAATSGLAAANNAAQQELIAAAKRDNRSTSPSLDDVRPGSTQSSGQNSAETNPLVLQRATPQIARTTQQEPSFSVAPAQTAKASPQPDFELDLENAVAEALSAKDTAVESEISFEDLLSSEMEQHFSNNEKPEQPETSQKPLGGMLDISPRK